MQSGIMDSPAFSVDSDDSEERAKGHWRKISQFVQSKRIIMYHALKDWSLTTDIP